MCLQSYKFINNFHTNKQYSIVEVYLNKVKCRMIEGCKVVQLNLMEVLNQCFHDIAAINLPPLPVVPRPTRLLPRNGGGCSYVLPLNSIQLQPKFSFLDRLSILASKLNLDYIIKCVSSV